MHNPVGVIGESGSHDLMNIYSMFITTQEVVKYVPSGRRLHSK